MRLICYPTSGDAPKIVPAPFERSWMDKTQSGFAYRCLPLNIANAHGWFILNEAPFVAQWNGSQEADSILIESLDKSSKTPLPLLAMSHFGNGVLTFSVRALFRTEPNYDLWVTGPTNIVKDGLHPLTGVVETDWSPFTFTMNWKFARKFTPVTFEKDEPFCMIFPIPRGLIESCEPEFRDMNEDPLVESRYTQWAQDRRSFNQDLHIEGSDAYNQQWQKDYFRGEDMWGKAPPNHRTRLKPREFTARIPNKKR